jgi:hypothetical protein
LIHIFFKIFIIMTPFSLAPLSIICKNDLKNKGIK